MNPKLTRPQWNLLCSLFDAGRAGWRFGSETSEENLEFLEHWYLIRRDHSQTQSRWHITPFGIERAKVGP